MLGVQEGSEWIRTPPRLTHLSTPTIYCAQPARGLNKGKKHLKNPPNIVNWKSQIVHGPLLGLDKIKISPKIICLPWCELCTGSTSAGRLRPAIFLKKFKSRTSSSLQNSSKLPWRKLALQPHIILTKIFLWNLGFIAKFSRLKSFIMIGNIKHCQNLKK